VQSTIKKTTVYVVLAQLCLLAAWQALAHSGAAGLTVPTPGSVMRVYLQPRFAALLYRSTLATVSSAVGGFAIGALLGTVTAIVSYVLPPLRPGLDRLAVTINAIPAVVLGPIFILLVSRELTPALLAAISVFFLIYVAVASGLRTASAGLSAMMTTFGAGRWQLLRYLDLPSAVPSFLSGVKVSVTAAMIGAVVGEWFGAPTGLGIVILNTMQNFEIPLMWAAVLLVALISLAGYGAAHAAERYVARRFL
jgi:ABC-type nitrate/sulfonate/bicarbonate transport system permease component